MKNSISCGDSSPPSRFLRMTSMARIVADEPQPSGARGTPSTENKETQAYRERAREKRDFRNRSSGRTPSPEGVSWPARPAAGTVAESADGTPALLGRLRLALREESLGSWSRSTG